MLHGESLAAGIPTEGFAGGSPIMFTSRVGAVCGCLPFLAANSASASEFYSYTGNNYETV